MINTLPHPNLAYSDFNAKRYIMTSVWQSMLTNRGEAPVGDNGAVFSTRRATRLKQRLRHSRSKRTASSIAIPILRTFLFSTNLDSKLILYIGENFRNNSVDVES